jgi:hypothetical protein
VLVEARPCLHCGAEFKPSKRNGAKFCTSHCSVKYRRAQQKAAKLASNPPPSDGSKRCARCKEVKPLDQFRIVKARNKPHSYCNECLRVIMRNRTRQRLGIPLDAPLMKGRRKPRPEGYTFEHHGYMIEKRTGHHRADEYGWVFQHILVAEEKYGFPITRDYTVHHRNGFRSDNRPENLELRYGNHGKGADVIDALLRIPEMRERAIRVLEGYGALVLMPSDLPELAG